MNIQSTKIELTKLILSIDNPKLIEKIKDLLLKETSDFWLELTDIQKEELKIGVEQLNNGERIAFKEYLKKVS